MLEVYNARYCSLHVRVGNATAYHLYKDTLGFMYVVTVLWAVCTAFRVRSLPFMPVALVSPRQHV
jgi:1,4-dihydroxy-2-naphthoate octaprenyltransferase